MEFKRLNHDTLIIEWNGSIDATLLEVILQYQTAISRLNGVLETWPSYHSLAVQFDPNKISARDLQHKVQHLTVSKEKLSPTAWRIPVCYDDSLGVDLKMVSDKLSMDHEQLITKHSAKTYTVHFLGFLPGFMYLGGLDQLLHIDRKSSPSLSVHKGSVAIGGSQTGIYPQDSPGGWYVIGRTPIALFDIRRIPVCFVRPGDTIRFESIDRDTYDVFSKAPPPLNELEYHG